MKLKNSNSLMQRDKARDADLIESYKKVGSFNILVLPATLHVNNINL